LATFHVEQISADHPAVTTLRTRYLLHFGLKADRALSSGVTWYAVYENAPRVALALVFAVGIRDDGGLEGSDLYMQPTRAGVAACYYILRSFRTFIDAKIFPYGVVSTAARNKAMHRRIARAFGVTEPCTVTFAYGGT
jgi:hypothetical protein